MSTAAPTATTLGDAVYERLMRERIVFLGREVDDVIANELCAQMLLLSAEDPTRDIHLYVNSPGGSVMAGLAVYATMRFVDCDVATYAMGMAASMGQFLVTAGTAGKRYTLPHTRILMHQPSAGLRGTAADITIQAEMLRQLKQQVNELQAEHSGQDVEQIARDSERDRWFSPAEAQAYGLVDHVLPDESALPPR
ncbi:ATP-dependent Clp protease proteolytic subunit [Modestobacter roseus]|nr:ATP-dependent Clp protease proteolytic subunit [Modestobacter roseus]MQA36056.1 ATP-dependent Clp protease proteolytic subunit [Modestobacter roseus]